MAIERKAALAALALLALAATARAEGHPGLAEKAEPASAAQPSGPPADAGASPDDAPASATEAAAPTPQADATSAPARTLPPPAAELAYRAKVKAQLAPLLAIRPSPEEARLLAEAVKARAPTAALALADPVARKLALWQAHRAGAGSPEDIQRFAEANPAWPDRQLLARRAEEQLFTRGGDSGAMKAFFGAREPVSGAGWAALASAFLLEGDEARARTLAQRAWTDEAMPASLETGFLERFGRLLTPPDHRRRLDRVLVDRVRFAADRRERATIARRVIPLLPEAERKAAEARLAVFLRDRNAAKLLAALPADPSPPTDWPLAFARAVHHLEADRLEAAAAILTAIPDEAEKLVNADAWWLARREAAYDALTAGRPQLAYDLVKRAGPLSVNPLKEQAHMAGWMSLRLADKPQQALGHFEAAMQAADGPLSRARSAYWTGRTLEALGRKDEARERYRLAMRDADTFHGLLARQRIAGSARAELTVTPPAVPSETEVQRFLALDAVRAAVLAHRARLDRNHFVGLMAGLRNHLRSEGELALLAELAASLGDAQTSLRVGKAAVARGLNLILYAYPIDPFPIYDPVRPPPETAMLLAIARQETEFNPSIISTAGARGLLQVMPITARHVCQQHKLKCDIPRLITDNAYNARIASAYVADRMAELGGWYAVALAAYNAGPGRARQWIRQNGDPRTGAIDPLDWIERIHIEETRHYVEKVLSNIQVYRARLGETQALRLAEDLSRPTGARTAATR